MTEATVGDHHPAVRDDLILIVQRLETGEPGPERQALAVRDGRIVWLGTAAEARRRTGPRIELDGAVALPGLVDAHTHPTWVGQALEQLDLRGLTPAALADRLKASKAPEGRWIRGAGWTALGDPAALPQVETPTLVHRVDRHVAWANRSALRAAGIGPATEDPPGGRFVRDRHGVPTGECHDTAIRMLLEAEPAPTSLDHQRWLKAASARFSAAGLTAVHDVCASVPDLRAWRALAADRRLRVHALVDGEDPEHAQILSTGPSLGPWLSVAGVKFFADGALGSRTAWLSRPYADAEHAGLPGLHGAELHRRAARWAEAGFQVAVHAIGDAAARDAVAVLSAVTPVRHRVEHAQIVDPSTVRALGAAGLVAGIQPTHACSDAPWIAERLGSERVEWAFRWRDLMRAGARLAIGSDCPIEPADPLAALRAALTPPVGQGLDFDAALAGCTRGAAWAAFAEKERGRLALGFVGDITVLDRDPRVALRDGAPLSIRATFVEGRATFGPV